jgi:selenocysteine lyase/cysteine desulfurase
VNGISTEQVARSLAADGLFLSHGDFYATTVTEKLGVGEDGVVRAGAACYTTRDEVDRLVRSVAALR